MTLGGLGQFWAQKCGFYEFGPSMCLWHRIWGQKIHQKAPKRIMMAPAYSVYEGGGIAISVFFFFCFVLLLLLSLLPLHPFAIATRPRGNWPRRGRNNGQWWVTERREREGRWKRMMKKDEDKGWTGWRRGWGWRMDGWIGAKSRKVPTHAIPECQCPFGSIPRSEYKKQFQEPCECIIKWAQSRMEFIILRIKNL